MLRAGAAGPGEGTGTDDGDLHLVDLGDRFNRGGTGDSPSGDESETQGSVGGDLHHEDTTR